MRNNSSSPTAISVRSLSKDFRIRAEHRGLSILGALSSKNRKKTLNALADINLDVAHGETLGIVGMNGSGKSTLLKIIAGIMNPTSGSVSVRGQVGSLIELGAGFHPELSGYENIYLNGTILGIPRQDIDHLLPQIVEFAGLERFIDMPVKHYSSGMQMRLGFAIAVQLKPDVLLLDETLSVGDAEFQTKALQAIRAYHDTGATTVMVSHDVFSIRTYADRAIWLHEGRIRDVGDPAGVVDSYLDHMMAMAGVEPHQMDALNGDRLYDKPLAAHPPLRISALALSDEKGREGTEFDHPQRLTLSIHYETNAPVSCARACVALYSRSNNALILEKDSEASGFSLENLGASGQIRFTFDCHGLYSESLGFVAAIFAPGEHGELWARSNLAFELSGHAQPTPEDFRYILAPCGTYAHEKRLL